MTRPKRSRRRRSDKIRAETRDETAQATTKFYLWADLRMNTVDVERLIGQRLQANRHYTVDPRSLPSAFHDRLAKDAFDLTRNLTLEATIGPGGFGIRVDQQ